MTNPTTKRAQDVPEEKWIKGRLHLMDSGPKQGEPVVFVHGFACDVSYWSEQMAHVSAQGRRAVALDLRGHGHSASPADGDYSMRGLASDVETSVDALGLPRFVLVGHSLGAAVAGEYAGAHPDRVSALVLVDPAGDNPRLPAEWIDPYRKALATEDYRQAVEQYMTGLVTHARAGVRERVFEGLHRAPRDLVIHGTLTSLDYSVLPALARYRAAGGRALTITADQNQGPLTLHALVPDLPRRHIPGTSHYIALDKPEELDRVLDEALSSAVWQR